MWNHGWPRYTGFTIVALKNKIEEKIRVMKETRVNIMGTKSN